ncbi:MAG TPA: divergent polysaccharide deacetylase family protein [Thermoanaerobaculia bacterium]|nr:divergent polysaccharide deacetylase family protein [Thermoanaerobaculia bacterium]
MARRSRSERSKAGGIFLFLLGLFAGAGILYLFLKPSAPRGAETQPPAPARSEAPKAPRRAEHRKLPSDHVEPETPAAVPAATQTVTPAGPVHGARIALVIDDLGHDVAELTTLEALGVPVTYSVLPYEPQTPEVVAELRRRKAEILLHLPMEPVHGENPGPGALLQGMSDGELRQKTEEALKAVPGAVGVNNHMGSLLSSEEGPMNAVLSVLAERSLFFLDSRTSAQSVGYKVALELGVPAAERQVFLDGEATPEAIHAQFQRLLSVARAKGSGIAIGHPHPETLAALAREVPKAKAEGFEFVPVSYLLTKSGGE